jgi:hypothetical protein
MEKNRKARKHCVLRAIGLVCNEKRRVDKIRTCDPLHPIQVRYRAAPLPEL